MFIVRIANVLSYFNLLWSAAAATVGIATFVGKHEDAYMQSTMEKVEEEKLEKERAWLKKKQNETQRNVIDRNT